MSCSCDNYALPGSVAKSPSVTHVTVVAMFSPHTSRAANCTTTQILDDRRGEYTEVTADSFLDDWLRTDAEKARDATTANASKPIKGTPPARTMPPLAALDLAKASTVGSELRENLTKENENDGSKPRRMHSAANLGSERKGSPSHERKALGDSEGEGRTTRGRGKGDRQEPPSSIERGRYHHDNGRREYAGHSGGFGDGAVFHARQHQQHADSNSHHPHYQHYPHTHQHHNHRVHNRHADGDRQVILQRHTRNSGHYAPDNCGEASTRTGESEPHNKGRRRANGEEYWRATKRRRGEDGDNSEGGAVGDRRPRKSPQKLSTSDAHGERDWEEARLLRDTVERLEREINEMRVASASGGGLPDAGGWTGAGGSVTGSGAPGVRRAAPWMPGVTHAVPT